MTDELEQALDELYARSKRSALLLCELGVPQAILRMGAAMLLALRDGERLLEITDGDEVPALGGPEDADIALPEVQSGRAPAGAPGREF